MPTALTTSSTFALLIALTAQTVPVRSATDVRAALLEIARSPDGFDLRLLDRVASAADSGSADASTAISELTAAYRATDSSSRRVALLRCLERFTVQDSEHTLVPFFARCVERALDPLESDAAAHALALCGTPGREVLRHQVQRGRSFHAVLAAAHELTGALEHLDATDGEWLESLGLGHRHERLVAIGLPHTPEFLERYAQERVAALQALLHVEGARVIAHQNALIEECSPTILKWLLRQGWLEVTPSLRDLVHELATDESAETTLRVAALDRLRRLADAAAIERMLAVVLTTPDRTVREFATRCLQQSVPDRVVPLLLPHFAPRAPPAAALCALDLAEGIHSDAVDLGVRQAMRHPDPWVQVRAIELLGSGESDADLPLLQAACADRDALVRGAAICARTRRSLTDVAWRDELLEVAHHNEPLLRIAAANSFGVLRDATFLPALCELASDADWRVRSAALDALGVLRPPQSVAFLVARLAIERAILVEKIVNLLRAITGQPLFGSDEWQRWLDDHGDNFVVPSDAEVAALEARIVAARSKVRTHARFYGVEFLSDHVAFVIDQSASMEQLVHGGDADRPLGRFDVAREELLSLIDRLPDRSWFNVHCFQSSVASFQTRLAACTAAVRTRADQWLRARLPQGGTNLYAGLEAALRDPEVDTVLLLSDGQPSVGNFVDPATLRWEIARLNPARAVRIHTIALGDANQLLADLAADSGGSSVVIDDSSKRNETQRRRR